MCVPSFKLKSNISKSLITIEARAFVRMNDAIALFSAAHWLDFVIDQIVSNTFFLFCRTFKQKFLTDASEKTRCSPYRVLRALSLCPPPPISLVTLCAP